MSNRVGQQFGDYRLTRRLGGGGFGDVYLGTNVRDHTFGAVKVLQARLTQATDIKEFINEARTFRLKHPNIVPLLDFGIAADDTPFLVVDYAPKSPYVRAYEVYPRLGRQKLLWMSDQSVLITSSSCFT